MNMKHRTFLSAVVGNKQRCNFDCSHLVHRYKRWELEAPFTLFPFSALTELRSKMILKLPLTLARFSGLLINFERRSRWFYLITILTILNTANFVMGIAHFMLKHLDNFDYFTNSFGAFSNMLVNILKTCMFLSTNEKLRIMMRKLEGLALDDRRSNYAFSSEADRLTDSYTKKFLVIVYISVFGITFAPLMAVAWEYFTTGQVVDTNWALPFKSEL